jgi:hypothetical protein
MFKLTDSSNGKEYLMLRWDTINRGDLYLVCDDDDIEICRAEQDVPEEFGSFILEEIIILE